MRELVLTKKQRLQMHSDQEIAAQFKELRAQNPGASDRRLIETIASERTAKPLSCSGVRLCLVRAGVISPESPAK